MKKFFTIFSLALTSFFVFACNLQMPKAIQIIGNPELKFSANWEVDIFKDMIESAFGGDDDSMEIYECTNAPQYKTFLIRMEIYDGNVFIGGTNVNPGSGGKQTLINRMDLTSSGNNPKRVSISGFGNHLEGFKLVDDNVESKLYVDGSSEIVTATTIKLTGDVHVYPSPGTAKKAPQRISLADNAHTLQELPDGGIDVVLPPEFFTGDAGIDIGYDVYLASGEEIETSWLNQEHNFKVELAIWIPLVLEAEKDDAKLMFDSFEGIGDFFTSMSESGFIESLILEIGMNANPFKEGVLVINDINNTNFKIINSMSADALNFVLSEDDVKYINENDFDPKFSIWFKKDDVIRVSNVFNITTVSLTAQLNFIVELWGN